MASLICAVLLAVVFFQWRVYYLRSVEDCKCGGGVNIHPSTFMLQYGLYKFSFKPPQVVYKGTAKGRGVLRWTTSGRVLWSPRSGAGFAATTAGVL